jgi:glycosyltransferase involved in cell wall biosynthesis
MKLAIAIPTFNRIEKLKTAIDHINKQTLNSDTELYCIISNTASNDGTFEYLSELKSNSNISYIISNRKEKNIYQNWLNLSRIIPDFIDWVWFHGDDDYLSNENSLQIVCDVIKNHTSSDITLVHACQTGRSRSTGSTKVSTLFDLCNSIGYHEILGWMSSLVVRRDKFVVSLNQATCRFESFVCGDDYLKNKVSAYSHSASLFENCYSDQAVFIDLPLISLQDKEQTPDTLSRWADGHTGERYFFVIDDLLRFKNAGLLGEGVNFVFLRYLNQNLWDRLLTFAADDVLKNGSIQNNIHEHLIRLEKISELFEKKSDRKIYLNFFNNFLASLFQYLTLVENMHKAHANIIQLINNNLSPTYPFEILNENGEIVG